MTRSGNRQLNAALHRIAVTQIRLDGLGRTYYRHRLAQGDSTPEALRCLKRRLAVMSREVGQSRDWWLASDGGVGSMVIVEMQPPSQGYVTLVG